MSTAARCPHVHRAINRITGCFSQAGIGRLGRNLADGYDFRRFEDLVDRLAPLLATHRLNILPRILRRQEFDRQCDGVSFCCVNVHMAYDIVSARDGSSVTVEAVGEAWDESDKATAKATTAAYKTAMFQLFCIPIASDEPESGSPRFDRQRLTAEPPEGWQAWALQFNQSVSACTTRSQLNDARSRHSQLLASLKREQPNVYASIGEIYAARELDLTTPGA